MTVEEIFTAINSHMIKGIMFHDTMSEYYDFLNLHGFKRCHEYHALHEFCEHRSLARYFINHYNKLLKSDHEGYQKVIPTNWYSYMRSQVDANTKKRAIRDGFTKWKEWESATKKLYESLYCELCDMKEIAAACKVKELISCVDMELKHVDRTHVLLESIDYDMPTITLMQDGLHEKYADKTNGIGVSIC